MSVPAERTWIVDSYVVDRDGNYLPDPQSVAIAMAELQAILTRVGGVATLATRRQEISPGRTETLALVIRWRSFVPMEKAQEAPEHEQETDAPESAPAPPVDDAEETASEMNGVAPTPEHVAP